MTAFLVLMIGAVVLVRIQPALPLSRLVEEWLARRPAAWLLRRSRREMIMWAIVAGLLMFGGEYVLVIGGPHMVMAFAADFAAYVDAVVAVATLASVARVRAVAQWSARRRVRRPVVRARRSRTRAVAKSSANNDERPRRLAA